MSLYTFFLDYRGGTYLFQVRATTFHDAAKVWAEEKDFMPSLGKEGESLRMNY